MTTKLKESTKTFIPNKILEVVPQIKLVGFYEFFVKRHKRRKEILEKDKKFFEELKKEDTVNVIIPVKNLFDHKIKNTIRSIELQDYSKEKIKITIIDYGSNKEYSKKLRELCKKRDIRYIKKETSEWNITNAQNIALKNSKEKYSLICLPDIIFKSNYIKEAVKELKKYPFQIILSQKLQLHKNHENLDKENYKKLEATSKSIQKNPYHQSMLFTLTHYFKKIRGYDEEIKYMYAEDDDIVKRLLLMGLKIKTIYKKSSYLHQYHESHQGKKEDIEKKIKQMKNNKKIMKSKNTIKRNLNGWGK